VTLRLCLGCHRHYRSPGIRNRCPDCGRALDRELSRQKRARRARNSAQWQKARAAAKQRDGNRCVHCGATEGLQVHHVVRLEDGGAAFELNNLVTLCVGCHGEQHRGEPGSTGRGAFTPRASFRERNRRSHGSGSRATRSTMAMRRRSSADGGATRDGASRRTLGRRWA
jgi:5-methylcytosine-specific restriction endonuclease McrA